MKKIGIFGGTFDPVHIGHLRAAEEFGRHLGLDRVLMVVSARPPHRGEPVAAAGHRMEMLKASVADNPLLDASDMELVRQGPSFTIDTVAEVSEAAGGSMPYLALGSDAWAEIGIWHRPEDVLAGSHVVVLTRPGVQPQLLPVVPDVCRGAYRRDNDVLVHNSGATLRTLAVTALDISSSRIRKIQGAAGSIRYLVPPVVFEYIQRNGLYRQAEPETGAAGADRKET